MGGPGVLFVNFLPSVDPQRRIAPEQAAFEQVVADYLRAGGGVVVFCGGGQWHGMSPAVRHLLKPYGASVPEEQIVDRQNEIGHVLNGRIVCNRTTAIAGAPMTRGISTIGYVGQASRADVIKLTVRIRGFHPGWQVAYLQDDSTTWRYFGQLDDYFYANFYTRVVVW